VIHFEDCSPEEGAYGVAQSTVNAGLSPLLVHFYSVDGRLMSVHNMDIYVEYPRNREEKR
jgi:hypothetical protein